MMRPPDPLWDETQMLVEQYFSQFSEKEMKDDLDEDDFYNWINSHASEKLKLYWDYRKWVGDEGQLCDGKGNYLLLDDNDQLSWIQDWDVNEDSFCVFKGTDTLILNTDGTPIKNPVLDKRVEDMYLERELDI